MRFDGKVALISGAGSGIGRATAMGFAARGAQVAVSDIDRAKAEAVTAGVRQRLPRPARVRLDREARWSALSRFWDWL
jgi:NAD(P)-dependent dehydrogenase (short-subunit alcohol dehydrogenase family)